MCSFSEVYYKVVWDDVFGGGWAISNSKKGSSGVGYVSLCWSCRCLHYVVCVPLSVSCVILYFEYFELEN